MREQTSEPTSDSGSAIRDLADEPLVARILAGSERAFEELMNRYESRIFSFGYRMCGQREDALDLTQETFLKAFESLSTLRKVSSLSSWLYTIAANICLMKKRKTKYESVLDLSTEQFLPNCDDGAKAVVNGWSRAPDELFLAEELRGTIDRSLLELSKKYRLVFVLRDLEGLSTAETANALGLTESTIKVRLHRARLQLREKLEDYFDHHSPPTVRNNRSNP